MLRIRIDAEKFEPEDVLRCAQILGAGGVGVIPTDTVYGIAARATDPEAVRRVLKIKQRAADKPLPVQVASSWDANLLGEADSPVAAALIESFWPGPLTIVMARRQGVELPFQTLATIGLRVPASRFCLELIEEAGYLVVPSANAPGQRAPVTPSEVALEILESVDFFVEAGDCSYGIESTVVDITAGVEVLREGAVPADAVLGAVGDVR